MDLYPDYVASRGDEGFGGVRTAVDPRRFPVFSGVAVRVPDVRSDVEAFLFDTSGARFGSEDGSWAAPWVRE